MKPKVYFASVRTEESLITHLGKMFDLAFPNLLKKDDLTAIKIHFGEFGSHAFIRPVFVRQIVEKIKENNSKPFISDTNTLYKGHRQNSVDHLNNAIANGFGYACTQAPLIIADGLWGRDYKNVKVDLKHFKEVKIGNAFVQADSMVVMSHMTGHLASGFGCAIKNVAMGCSSRAGKQQQHDSSKPKVNPKQCISCGKCVANCPVDAIAMNEKALIDQNKCIGCAECVTVCPTQAIAIMWGGMGKKEMQEMMCEYAYGATKGKRVGYINFLMNITPACDCWPVSNAYFVHDIGILASSDLLAIDKASIDLVQKSAGNPNSKLKNPKTNDKFKDLWGIDVMQHFSYGKKIGLGSMDYELVNVN
ncbi:MAG: DUF362 domain-containing protein [Nanoarchaeota archaeon]|nr:DUF362 domain-containing protein [Nanoarchaeota archaeon]